MSPRWTAVAEESLGQVRRWHAQFSEANGTYWVRRIEKAVENASTFPKKHRRVPEIDADDVREIIVNPYRIWFRILDPDDTIEVIVVFHGSMQVPD